MASGATGWNGPTRRTIAFCAVAAVLLVAAPAAALTPDLQLITRARPFLLFALGALGLVEIGRGRGRA
jgi:hypothetical protein